MGERLSGPTEEVARISTYAEAQVACSALQAAGIDAVLMDGDPVSNAWREPYGSGGFRLGAPHDQAAQARALLRQVEAQADPPETPTASRFADAPPPDRLWLGRLIWIAALFLAIAVAALIGRL
jgi:hypothetical protein